MSAESETEYFELYYRRGKKPWYQHHNGFPRKIISWINRARANHYNLALWRESTLLLRLHMSASLTILTAVTYVASYQFMAYMARPKFGESGQLLDSGVDLNMEGGIAEHVKDLIILTAGCQVLSLTSNYFWWLWILAPLRGFYMLWTKLLAPWFFSSPEPQPEMDEKKQRKLERKMARRQ